MTKKKLDEFGGDDEQLMYIGMDSSVSLSFNSVEGCERVEGLCNKQWGELEPTESDKQRYCGDCRKRVHLIGSDELEEMLKKNERVCVAFQP